MLQQILHKVTIELEKAENVNDLQKVRVEFLGKSSLLNQEMRSLASLPLEEKKEVGAKINLVKQQLENLINEAEISLQQKELEQRFQSEKLDLTAPARSKRNGSIHPTSQVMEELVQVFAKYGLSIKNGPDIEDDWYNFTALNIDENHPARQMHDTFYLNSQGSKKLLRTHTSPIQIRTMQNEKPPFYFIAPGRTYRCDSDLTHTPMFHQIEGLVIDKNIHMGHLKYIITDFISTFFEQPDIEVRFRPSFFPFTEPSAEVDIKMNKNDQWLEVLGCGMVHPSILQNVGIDPAEYQGFAFGLGVERFAMLKYNIKDLRQFFDGDLRWLKHYNFENLDIPTLMGGLTK